MAYTARLFKNLNLYTGLEGKYNTRITPTIIPRDRPVRVSEHPAVQQYARCGAFVNFRIKSFTAYVRGENLNSFVWNYNFNAPAVPQQRFCGAGRHPLVVCELTAVLFQREYLKFVA